MSYAELVIFRGDEMSEAIEYGNSWGGSARIWDAIWDKYMRDHRNPYDGWLMNINGERGRQFWQLCNSERLSPHERTVFAFTFDYALICRDDFKAFADDLLQFDKDNPTEPERVNHLPAWARKFAELLEDETVTYVGLHGTSVSENLWNIYDEETDAMVYTKATDERAFDAFTAREIEESTK